VEELNSGAKNAIKNFALLYENLVTKSKKIVVSELIKEIIKDTNYIEYLTD
jgi:hypothetical protein